MNVKTTILALIASVCLASAGWGQCYPLDAYCKYRGNNFNCNDPFCWQGQGTCLGLLTADDGERLILEPGFTLNAGEAPVWLVFELTSPNYRPCTKFKIDSHAGTPNLTATVEFWNWNTGQYDVIGSFAASFNVDRLEEYDIAPQYADANGSVIARVGWRKTGFTINFPWRVHVDFVGIYDLPINIACIE